MNELRNDALKEIFKRLTYTSDELSLNTDLVNNYYKYLQNND